jgi:hypothetical protein
MSSIVIPIVLSLAVDTDQPLGGLVARFRLESPADQPEVAHPPRRRDAPEVAAAEHHRRQAAWGG